MNKNNYVTNIKMSVKDKDKEEIEIKEFKLNFNNTEYILYVKSNSNFLNLTLEPTENQEYWLGSFESTFIEDISSKAGSYKAYSIFQKIFFSSLLGESNSAQISLLSSADLKIFIENSTEKINGDTGDTIQNGNNQVSQVKPIVSLNEESNKIDNKKYLLITYQNEFENLTYPLPLVYIPNKETEFLMRSIKRLNNENKILRKDLIEKTSLNKSGILTENLQKENLVLKNRIKILESLRPSGAVTNDEAQRQINSLKEEYDNYKIQSENKIKLLNNIINEERKSKPNNNDEANKNSHLNDKNKNLSLSINNNSSTFLTDVLNNNNLNNLKLDIEHNDQDPTSVAKSIEIMKSNIEVLENEKDYMKIISEEKNNEFESFKKDLKLLRENESKMKLKIIQLETDLQNANKRIPITLPSIKSNTVNYKNNISNSLNARHIRNLSLNDRVVNSNENPFNKKAILKSIVIQKNSPRNSNNNLNNIISSGSNSKKISYGGKPLNNSNNWSSGNGNNYSNIQNKNNFNKMHMKSPYLSPLRDNFSKRTKNKSITSNVLPVLPVLNKKILIDKVNLVSASLNSK